MRTTGNPSPPNTKITCYDRLNLPWSAPVGDGGVLTNACFGLRGCEEAADYLGSHPDDIAGAKVIAATYCLVHFAECRSEAAGQSFANGLEGLALGALGGLDGAVAEDPAVGKGLGCNSFTGDTQVLMADGTTKPISQVKVGDKITNAQPDSPTTQADTVTAVHITLTDRNYDQVTIATPAGPKTITSTAEHLYWDTTTHAWTRADNLNVGDQLDTPGDGHATVTATRHYTAAQITYNLTINETHTYYVVAGDTPVLVHNGGPGCGTLWINADKIPHHYMSMSDQDVMHAQDFGVSGPYNKANAQKFINAIENFTKNPGTITIEGTYRGQAAIHYVDPTTGLHASFAADGPLVGEYLGGWISQGAQLDYLLKYGNFSLRDSYLFVNGQHLLRSKRRTMPDSVNLTIELTKDQALVLSDWLSRKINTPEMASVIDDRAVWSSLLKINGSLETKIIELFSSRYSDQLAAARGEANRRTWRVW